VLGIAGGMAAMALWGNWNNNATPQQILLNFALFPTALGIAFLVLQLFLSITDHRLALIKGVVYLVLVAIGCWALPSLYQPQLPWVQQVQRLGIVPIGIAVALFADYLLGRWLEKSKPLQQESCEETVVLSKRG
jgi:uncharacterized membrane protein YwzB